jgi:hypothetical protein
MGQWLGVFEGGGAGLLSCLAFVVN